MEQGTNVKDCASISSFLIRRLSEAGIGAIFGIPGDFALALFQEILKHNEMTYIGTCNELNAAYAADGYARVKGIGALATTYAVGELSALNGVAGSWAENVPVVNIVGCPASSAFRDKPLLHHTLGDYEIPRKMFEKITCYSCIIADPSDAVTMIDSALHACLKYKKPVYIGVCSDMAKVNVTVPQSRFRKPIPESSNILALDEAVKEVSSRLNNANSPVIIPGREINKLGLENVLLQLLNNSGFPYATMLMGKSVISEWHPQHLGFYCGNRAREYVKNYVENSDCVLVIGETMTDFNTGGFTACLKDPRTISVTRNTIRVSCHSYHDVSIHDFLPRLAENLQKRNFGIHAACDCCVHRSNKEFKVSVGKKLTISRFFDRIAHFIPAGSIVIAETGCSLFGVSEVLLPEGVMLLEQSFYGSIGYTLGACLGACIANPERPVVLFIGDGSFQVCCQELSTLLRHKCKPLIFLINNDGYTIERVIVDGPFNDIQPWRYSELPSVFGGCFNSWRCELEEDLEDVLGSFEFKSLGFAEVVLDKMDCNEALRRAGRSMAEINNLLD